MIRFTTDDADLDLANLEIADTPLARERGFKGRSVDRPMLFPFKRQKRPTMTMHDVPEPLDMIFLDADFTVVEIHPNVQPETPSVRPERPAQAVLETPAGQARGLKPGDNLGGLLNGRR